MSLLCIRIAVNQNIFNIFYQFSTNILVIVYCPPYTVHHILATIYCPSYTNILFTIYCPSYTNILSTVYCPSYTVRTHNVSECVPSQKCGLKNWRMLQNDQYESRKRTSAYENMVWISGTNSNKFKQINTMMQIGWFTNVCANKQIRPIAE